MTKTKIYNLAMKELYRKFDYEKSFLKDGNKSGLASIRVANVEKDIDELHTLIVEAEYDEAYK